MKTLAKMNYKVQLLWIFILILGLLSEVQADDTIPKNLNVSSDTLEVDIDSSSAQLLKTLAVDTMNYRCVRLDSAYKQDYLSNEEFQYIRNNETYSFWQLVKKRIINFLRKLFGYAPDAPEPKFTDIVLKVLSILLVLFALYIIVRILIRNRARLFSKGKNEVLEIDINDSERLIQDADFGQLIYENEQTGNVRVCIRLYYLWTLRTLKNKNILIWLPDKTNAEYISEIKDSDLRKHFTYLTYLYEYVWYGEFQIATESYEKAKKSFENLIEKEVKNG